MQHNKTKALCLDAEWVGHPKCKTCAVRSSMLFADLPDEALEHLLQPVDNYRFHSRAHLYDQGDAGAYLFTIRSGIVKLEQSMPNGALRVVRLLHAGDVVGLEALVGNSYHHTAVALGEVDACRIATHVIQDLDVHSPQLHAQLVLRWQKNLNEADVLLCSCRQAAPPRAWRACCSSSRWLRTSPLSPPVGKISAPCSA